MKNVFANLIMGAIFGFLLSRSGAFEFHHVTGMFQFQDFHLIGLLGVAVPVIGIGYYFMRGKRMLNGGTFLPLQRNSHPGNFPGGLLFGLGWALTGTCPGTSFAQLGTGHWGALFTIVGIGAGVTTYRYFHRRFLPWQVDSCG